MPAALLPLHCLYRKHPHLDEAAAETQNILTADNIEEQIVQYYVQILYQTEAVSVADSTWRTSVALRDRGREMLSAGSLSRAVLAQLEAQASQDEYSLVSATTQLATYKMQLKQILEIIKTQVFDVATPDIAGTIEPGTQVEVGTQVSCIIDKIYVDYNSQVHKGQVIAELDKTDLLSELTSAQSNLANAQSELDYQKANFDRYAKLFEKGLVSVDEYETARLAFEKARQNIVVQQQNVTKAQTNVGYATITSPIDGVVLRLEATTESNVVTYEVVISAPNKELKLLPCPTANGTIFTAERNNVQTLPNKALRFAPNEALLTPEQRVEDIRSRRKAGPL